MQLSDLDYVLPPECIAQQPCEPRDQARLLALDRKTGARRDCRVSDLPDLLRAGDVLVLNDTRVFPARLIGRREPTGGAVEVFLVRETAPKTWLALVKPGRRVRVGDRLTFGDGVLRGVVTGRMADGRRLITFTCDGDFFSTLDVIGRTPLPPYITRATEHPNDRERYQTVYAAARGSIAAPTAGLHFTPALLAILERQGVEIAKLTLHVGYGTFQPVRTENLAEHRVEPEVYVVPEATARQITLAKRSGRRVIAVGTTSTRTLETVARATDDGMAVVPGQGMTDLTIVPGFEFRVLDGLLTNFHLPKSSLLALVVAFGGYQPVMEAYRHAVAARYRFYSYGDAMLLL
ncbi:MAG: tRNA preQ1(34) S-adenosylmethionine ribosyltransferase-isomerase QueA [Chloracidobacterium sp.]|uniref:S-adenosylmethionine:tRNA ribosyltransferase-isomerase n=1 Tax=Chloracidobacterium validum TaxID=2821543 RepID=A0ABX8BBF3_9BACT|nr:tRNA preQ1(34) S-adenosylmethionine ribosyltransferase-isomerase QueA [Chloracidobacterium validum]QUW02400.1 tRNA preQ1(34) S-adenosylmethionine ribosyltransferase-isomerase QueA [Chloracidobacterium validum]